MKNVIFFLFMFIFTATYCYSGMIDTALKRAQEMSGQDSSSEAAADARETAKEVLYNKKVNYDRYKKNYSKPSSNVERDDYKERTNHINVRSSDGKNVDKNFF